MGNKVKFTMKSIPAALSSINALVVDANYDKLWSGVQAVSGADVELDIGTAGTVGNGVWVYGDNASAGSESTAKVFGGYSLVEADPVTPTVKTYDAYVFIGDSITNQSAENREDDLVISAAEAGFDPSVVFYGSGLSGHTTKTFTEKFLGIELPTTSSRLLADYETLLAGKSVLFIDVLRTNDWKEVCVNGKDYATQKQECEQWTATLANAIKASTLDADYAIASQPYNDWRNINVRGPQGFDIIDGNAVQYDQTVAWQSEVVEALCQQHSPDWFSNGRCYFDLFTETRNYFRYWLGDDTDSIHPVINTSELYRTYFTKRAYEATQTPVPSATVELLYPYTQPLDFSVGEVCIFDFARTYDGANLTDQQSYLKNPNINLVSAGNLRESSIKKSDGTYVGNRSYLVTSGVNNRQATGIGNAGNDTVSLENHYLLKSASYVNAGESMGISITGLEPNAVFDMTIAAAYNSATSTSKVTANGTVITLSTTKIESGVIPTAVGSVTADVNGEIVATLESLDDLGFGMLSGISLTRTA